MTEVILNTRQTRKFTDDERRQIAVGWRPSGLGQSQYAAAHGIKPRTLRLWLNEHAPTLGSQQEIRTVGEQMLEALRHAAALLEEALSHAGDADRRAVKPAPLEPDDGAASMTITTPRAISSAGHSELTLPKRTGKYLFDDDE